MENVEGQEEGGADEEVRTPSRKRRREMEAKGEEEEGGRPRAKRPRRGMMATKGEGDQVEEEVEAEEGEEEKVQKMKWRRGTMENVAEVDRVEEGRAEEEEGEETVRKTKWRQETMEKEVEPFSSQAASLLPTNRHFVGAKRVLLLCRGRNVDSAGIKAFSAGKFYLRSQIIDRH